MLLDVHVHLTPPEIAADRDEYLKNEAALAPLYRDPKSKMVSTDELLEMMDAEGVDLSLVMGFPWSNEDTAKRHNEWLLEQALRHPRRLRALAAFDLAQPWAVKHAEDMLKCGMFGLGELAIYDRAFNERDLDVLEELGGLCRAGGRPFLVHVNESIGHQYPGKAPLELSQIFQLVRRCQGVKLILAHFGGGLPFLAALKREVKNALAHTRFDTAVMPFLYDPAALPMAMMVLGEDHFLLGTDFPLLKPSRYSKYFAEAGLDQRRQDRIMGQAAADFLGFSLHSI